MCSLKLDIFCVCVCVCVVCVCESRLTSGGELFGVNDFGRILLACAQLDTSAHNRKRSPATQRGT